MSGYLVDSDVLLNTLLKTEKQKVCVKFLNEYEDEISSTILNIMEISSVLSRKYRWEGEDIREAVNTIEKGMEIMIPSESEIIEGYELVYEDFFSPIDAILLTLSKGQNQVLVTYDGGLLKRGNKHTEVNSPNKIIE